MAGFTAPVFTFASGQPWGWMPLAFSSIAIGLIEILRPYHAIKKFHRYFGKIDRGFRTFMLGIIRHPKHIAFNNHTGGYIWNEGIFRTTSSGAYNFGQTYNTSTGTFSNTGTFTNENGGIFMNEGMATSSDTFINHGYMNILAGTFTSTGTAMENDNNGSSASGDGRINIESGASFNAKFMTNSNTGELSNFDSLTVLSGGTLTNRGIIASRCVGSEISAITVDSGALLNNYGSVGGSGADIVNRGAITNQTGALIETYGTFDNNSGTLTNDGTFKTRTETGSSLGGTVDRDGETNSGIFTTYDTVYIVEYESNREGYTFFNDYFPIVPGESPPTPGVPESSSEYTFAGWYTDEALTVPFSSITGNMKLYAKWMPSP